MRRYLGLRTGTFLALTIVFALAGGDPQTGIQTAVAQEAPDRDLGRIALTSKPDGSTVFVSLELPQEGKFDGLFERCFIIRGAAEPPSALQGSGRVETGGRGAYLDSLSLVLDDGGLWVFVATAASSATRDAVPSDARVFEVDLIIHGWSVRPDNPLMPPGSPGTGRVSHQEAVKDLFSRPNLP